MLSAGTEWAVVVLGSFICETCIVTCIVDIFVLECVCTVCNFLDTSTIMLELSPSSSILKVGVPSLDA